MKIYLFTADRANEFCFSAPGIHLCTHRSVDILLKFLITRTVVCTLSDRLPIFITPCKQTHLYIAPSMMCPQTKVMSAATITAKMVLLSMRLCVSATFISVKWSSIYQQIIITVSRAFSADKGLPALALFGNSVQLNGIKSHTTIG